jgi:hypothetical protein
LYRVKILAKDKQSCLLVPFVSYKENKVLFIEPLFKALHYLWNFRMGPINWSVTLYRLKMLAKEEQSSLLVPFVSYEENEMF